MKTEADFKDGDVVIYCNKDRTRKFTGLVDYSEGTEKKGYIRVRQVFTETPDTGNVLLIPPSCIYDSIAED